MKRLFIFLMVLFSANLAFGYVTSDIPNACGISNKYTIKPVFSLASFMPLGQVYECNADFGALYPAFERNQHNCSPGYYMPANYDGCTPCPADSYCPGGTYTFNETTAQGATKCPNGYDYNTNTGKSSVNQCQIHCDAGTSAMYTQLEYIESTGTQWIDTGVSGLGSGDWEIYLKWMPLSTTVLAWASPFGTYTNEQTNTYRIIHNDNSTTSYLLYGNSRAGGGGVGVNNVATGAIHEVLLGNGYAYLDNVRYTTTLKGETIPDTTPIKINPSSQLKGRFYASWATKDGVYKYNFIPVRRNSDGAIGMYDTVTETFFGNSGTGTFVAGSEKSLIVSCALCPENSYCPGETLNYGATTSNGIIACASGLFAPAGMWEAEQCGRILHVGDGFVYLRSTKKTEHALHVDLDHDGIADYFGNMTTLDVPMSRETQRKLKVRMNGVVYSIYDDSVDLSLYGNE